MATSAKATKIINVIHVVVTGALWGFGFYSRQTLSAITHAIEESFDINASGISALSSGLLISFAIMQIPAGIILEILSPEFAMVVSISLIGLFILIFGFCNTFAAGLVVNILLGIVASIMGLADWALIEERYGNKYIVLVGSITQAIGIGLFILWQYCQAEVYDVYGKWREIYWAFGSVCIGTALLYFVFLFAENKISKSVYDNILSVDEMGNVQFVRVFKSPSIKAKGGKQIASLIWDKFKSALFKAWNWYLSFFSINLHAIEYGLSFLWLIPYLHVKYGFDLGIASLINGVLVFSWGVGSIIFGKVILTQCGKRRKLSLLVGIIMEQSLLILIYGGFDENSMHIGVVITICVISGVGSSVSLVLMNMVRDYNVYHKCTNGATGFINGMNFVGAVLIQFLIGGVLDYSWKKNDGVYDSNGVRVYTAHDFELAFIVFPITGVLCLVLLLFVKETYGEPVVYGDDQETVNKVNDNTEMQAITRNDGDE